MKILLARDYFAAVLVALVVTGCQTSPHSMTPHHIPIVSNTALVTDYKYVDPPAAIAPNDFRVTYVGIVAHAQITREVNGVPKYYRRAIVLQGGAFDMRHEPLIGVYGADIASLGKLAGQAVQSCDFYYCWVLIHGIDMRVVDEIDTGGKPLAVPITDSVNEDSSYVALVPHLYNDNDIDGGGIRSSMITEDLPPPPSEGYFEMAGGTLSACPFSAEARFLRKDKTYGDCHQFAHMVFWTGQTTHRARLQIRSKLGDWETVKLKSNTMPLRVAIVNVGTEHQTSRHFILNRKITQNDLPTIDTDYCQACVPGANHVCYVCMTGLNDIAGCSNSQWP